MADKRFFFFLLFVLIIISSIIQITTSNPILDDNNKDSNFDSFKNDNVQSGQQTAFLNKLKMDWSNLSMEGFWASFSMIIVSEIGDKTFFIAAVLAMKHSRFVVWLGAASALFVMTILAVVFGSFFQYLPFYVTQYLAGLIFFAFAFKLLRDAKNMKGGEANDELREVEQQILEEESKKREGFINNKMNDIELGNRNKNKHADIGFKPIGENAKNDMLEVNKNDIGNDNDDILANDDEYSDDPKGKKRFLRNNVNNFSILTRSFIMTFISEIGDRSQISTVVLAAHKNPYGVTLGASSGHAICTGLAVIGGKLLASRISEKNVTLIGGILFLLFGLECFIYGPSEYN